MKLVKDEYYYFKNYWSLNSTFNKFKFIEKLSDEEVLVKSNEKFLVLKIIDIIDEEKQPFCEEYEDIVIRIKNLNEELSTLKKRKNELVGFIS